MQDNKKLLIIIPCYNEQDSINDLLKEISSIDINHDILVIDDGSLDDTFSIASKQSRVIKLIQNLGIGGAVQTGFKYAHYNKYEFCIQIDGDGQHDPKEIKRLFTYQARTASSITVGSRYIENDSFQSTFARRSGSKLISFFLKLLFKGTNITDPTSGMRLMDTKAIKFFKDNYPYDFPEPISLAWALKENMTVSETSVKMREREYGKSSITGLKSLIYMIRVIGYIVLARFIKIKR